VRILLPVDGSAASQRAVAHVAALAKGNGMEVILLNVQPPMPLYGMVRAYLQPDEYDAACAAQARKALDPAARLLRRKGVEHKSEIAYGEPGAAIAASARKLKCGSIVMGTRGQGAIGNLILGSVATKVIHLSNVPVTLVK
jgi:nucleotide-binding universal stress UspA family protein